MEFSDEDGIGIQEIDDVKRSGVSSEVSLIRTFDGNYYAEYSFRLLFRYDWQDPSYGEAPNDSVGLRWNNACWEFAYGTHNATTSQSEHVQYHANSRQGSVGTYGAFGAEVNDELMFGEWFNQAELGDEEYSDTQYFGVFLSEISSGCNSNAQTTIEAVYSHAYTGRYHDFAISISTSGIGIVYDTGSTVEAIETTDDKLGQTPLEIRKDDATWG